MNKRESQYIEELNTGWDGGLGGIKREVYDIDELPAFPVGSSPIEEDDDNDVLRAVQEERDEYRRQRDEIVFKYLDLLEQCLYGGRIDE
jgi:hypothetical protein